MLLYIGLILFIVGTLLDLFRMSKKIKILEENNKILKDFLEHNLGKTKALARTVEKHSTNLEALNSQVNDNSTAIYGEEE